MSRSNAPNVPGGFRLTGVFSNLQLAGISETGPPEKSSGHAPPGRNTTDSPKRKGNGHAAAAPSSGNSTETSTVPGLAELVEVLSAMAATPLGARPKLNQDSIEKIKNSSLHSVLNGLKLIYQKIGPLEGSPEHLQTQAIQWPNNLPPSRQPPSTPGPSRSSAQQPTPAAAPAAAGITNAEASLRSVSTKLNSVSQAVTDMKASTKAAKDQVEAVDKKVSQVSGRLEPALADLAQEVKKLQVDMMDEFNGERTRFETKVKGLKTNIKDLEEEVKELKKETKELQQVIRDTKAELLPVEVASEIALQGTFSEEPNKKCGSERPNKAPSNLLQTAKKVRSNTLDLITKCRVLFAVLDPGLETGANAPDISMEGEWSRCAEHLRTSNAKLRNAVVEKEETIQKLHLVGLVLDQMRRGNSVQLVSQDLSRPTGQPASTSDDVASSTAPERSKPSTTDTVIAVSQACTSFSDLNPSFYLS
ncbi:hypothetical protein FS837_010766 [Tulasnella sp. UAMH 9824]|nr:hypothetical protein FS837_010766 [Tulasnella sp. UAMH 9824]